MEELLAKIEQYVEFEERITLLLASLTTLKGILRKKKILKDIGKIEDDCDLIYQQIIDEIRELTIDRKIELKKVLEDRIKDLEEEIYDNCNIKIVVDKMNNKQQRLDYYLQFFNCVTQKNNVKSINYSLDYDD